MSEVITKVEKAISKSIGDVIFSGETIAEDVKKVISVSPNLDLGLGGGIPEGSLVIVAGPPKSGKTTMILSLIAECQKLGRNIWYLDIEHRLQRRNLKGIRGLDASKMRIIKSTQDKIMHAEDFLGSAEEAIRGDVGSVVVLDSGSAICSQKEYTDPLTSSTRSLGPKLMATFCRRNAPIIGINKNIVIVVHHLIANTSGYGKPFLEDGGNKIQYQMDVKLVANKKEDWVAAGRSIGFKTHWKIECTALDAPPGHKAETFCRYGVGLDKLAEIIEAAINLGIIEEKKAWLLYKEKNYNGREKFYQFLMENPDEQATMEKSVRELMGFESS